MKNGMCRRTVKLSFRSAVSAVLAVVLLFFSVSTRATSPNYPTFQLDNRAERATAKQWEGEPEPQAAELALPSLADLVLRLSRLSRRRRNALNPSSLQMTLSLNAFCAGL